MKKRIFIHFLKQSASPLALGALALFSTLLHGDATEEPYGMEMLEAKQYADAQLFEPATAIYEALRITALQPWQQMILSYNLGTVALQAGEWTKAINILSALSSDNETAPFMAWRIQLNIGVAHYRYAMALTDNKPPRILDARLHFKEAISAFESASVDYCTLLHNNSSFSCTKLAIAEKLLTAAKRQMATTATAWTAERIGSLSILEALSWLNVTASSLHEQIMRLAQASADKPLRGQYAQLWGRQLEAFNAVWQALELHLQALTAKEQQLFNHAKDDFNAAIAALQEEDLQVAESSLQSLQKGIVQLFGELIGGAAWKRQLYQLLGIYQILLTEEFLQEANWQLLLKEYSQPPAELAQQPLFAASARDAESGYAAFQAGKSGEARANFLAANSRLQLLASPLAELSPKSFLQQLINLETSVGKIAYIAMQEPSVATVAEAVALQEDLIATANQFFNAVYKQQLHSFNVDKRCQAHPWARVMELFDGGRQHAMAVQQRLAAQPVDQQTIALLEKTVQQWLAALAAIDDPHDSSSCRGAATAPQAAETPVDSIIQALLQMDKNDAKGAPQPIAPAPIAKPW